MFQSVYAAGETVNQPLGGGLSMFLFMGVFFLFFYVAIIRPKQQKELQHRKLVSSLGVGDEIITYGGLMGKVIKVKDEYLVINIADNVEIKMQKNHISHVLPKGTLKAI